MFTDDLRGNRGGSIVPMLGAVGPLLGAGHWLSYRRRDGSSLRYHYATGEVHADGHCLLVAPRPLDDAAYLPVAVLCWSPSGVGLTREVSALSPRGYQQATPLTDWLMAQC